MDSWNKIGAAFNKIDGSTPRFLSNHSIVYLLPGDHSLEIRVYASLDFDIYFPVSGYITSSGTYETIGEWETVSLKSWDDTKTMDVHLLPGKEYDLIVAINMLADRGEFQISIQEREISSQSPGP